MKISEMFTMVRKELDDTSSPYKYDNKRLLLGLNAFGRDLVALGKDTTLSSAMTLTANVNYEAFPASYWFPVNARIKDTDIYLPLTILRGSNTGEIDFLSKEITGKPQFIFIKENKFYLYPTPDSDYELIIEFVAVFDKITDSDLDDEISVYLDNQYEDYILDYLKMKVLKKNNTEFNQIDLSFNRQGGYWDKIKKIENLKYAPFNAKNRRTNGVSNINRPDYS